MTDTTVNWPEVTSLLRLIAQIHRNVAAAREQTRPESPLPREMRAMAPIKTTDEDGKGG